MPKIVRKPQIFSILDDTHMDDDFLEIVDKFKEKQLSPMEMDLKIQADRVVYIINRTLAKIHLMAHLPAMIENEAEMLKKYLKRSELHFVLQLLNKYGTEFGEVLYDEEDYRQYLIVIEKLNSSATRIPPISKTAEGGAEPPLADPAVFQMIDILFYNKCLRRVINNDKPKHVDTFMAHLLRVLNDFKKVAKMKLYVTGDEEDATNKELRRAYKANVLLAASIRDLTEQLEAQRKELGNQLNQKVAVFDKYNTKMEEVTDEFKIQMQKNLLESERVMMHKSLESEQTQAELAEKAKKLVAQYDSLLEEHLIHEKVSRAKRLKAETMLQSWLTKFDQEVGDKQAEYEALKKEYDEKRAKIEELEELLDDQEDEYNTLMEEKRIEEERIANEIAIEYLRNRAARLIQRCWRAYKERRAARKRGKKGKGKGRGRMNAVQITSKKQKRRKSVDVNQALEQDKKMKSHVFDELEDPNLKFEAK